MAALVPFLIVLTSLPLLAAPPQSLGDVARQLRQQQPKAGSKTIITNDNLPGVKPEGDFQAASVPPPPSAPAATTSGPTAAETEATPAPTPASQASGSTAGAPPSDDTAEKPKEYWQPQFKALREQLAGAEERQKLVEDELSLLQSRAARALDSNVKNALAEQITAKQDELAQKQAATTEARKAFEDFQSDFDASGAPEEWSEEPEVRSQ